VNQRGQAPPRGLIAVNAEMSMLLRQMEEMRQQIAMMAAAIDALCAATGQPHFWARTEPVTQVEAGTVGLTGL
jgi:hypothetical protein